MGGDLCIQLWRYALGIVTTLKNPNSCTTDAYSLEPGRNGQRIVQTARHGAVHEYLRILEARRSRSVFMHEYDSRSCNKPRKIQTTGRQTHTPWNLVAMERSPGHPGPSRHPKRIHVRLCLTLPCASHTLIHENFLTRILARSRKNTTYHAPCRLFQVSMNHVHAVAAVLDLDNHHSS